MEISGPSGELMRAFTCCWSRFHPPRLSGLVNHLSGCVYDEFFLSSQKSTQANGAILLEVRLFVFVPTARRPSKLFGVASS